MPLTILIVTLLIAAVLYYLYSSGNGTTMQVNPSDENINVTPVEETGVSYTTE